MAEPFLSEIRLFSFNFAPKGWALCNGQLLPINQNQALFSLLGTTFGGDGRVNFALPDLRGRVPIHVGTGHILGERGGEQAHRISFSEMPQHTHSLHASAATGDSQYPAFGPAEHVLAAEPGNLYAPGVTTGAVTMHAETVSFVGQTQTHLNMQPFLTTNFCIALQGIFPSPT
ncbi:phage tail protein [Sphingosinithalassobacter sp. LHW66-3]|uniref:phage tail protein n=1 Tax=Sphingosinithalassobacter sp. LHW66-3 TaxID=3424718 RepID=UPI003D6C50DA